MEIFAVFCGGTYMSTSSPLKIDIFRFQDMCTLISLKFVRSIWYISVGWEALSRDRAAKIRKFFSSTFTYVQCNCSLSISRRHFSNAKLFIKRTGIKVVGFY